MARLGRSFAVRLALLTAAGVVLRLVYLLTIGRHVTGIGDWFFYHWQANDIAAGRGFVEPYRLRFDHVALPSAGHPPLYPLVLSGVSALGGTGELAHRLVGLPLGAATIALVGLLGRRAGGERVGLVAAGLCAVYPIMIATDGALMSETLYGPLIALVLLGVSFVARIPHGVRWAALVLLLVLVQGLLGGLAHDVPALGALHGLNALLLFTAALVTARRAAAPSPSARPDTAQPASSAA
jgi:4-amino-4-deoxy-L-arabinose transferase-like glycosyltransferase